MAGGISGPSLSGPATSTLLQCCWVTGSCRRRLTGARGFGPILSYAFAPVIGQWYHIAFTFDDQTRQQVLYVNSITVASGLGNRAIGYDSQPVLLGCDLENGSRMYFFGGRIDEPTI